MTMTVLNRTVFGWLVVIPMMAMTVFAGCAERSVESHVDNGITHDEAIVFLSTVQKATESSVEFSKIIRYPMYAYEEGKGERVIRNANDFSEVFPSVLTSEFVTLVKRFDPGALWANSDGFMICDGQLWFAKIAVTGTDEREIFVTVIQSSSAKVRISIFRQEP